MQIHCGRKYTIFCYLLENTKYWLITTSSPVVLLSVHLYTCHRSGQNVIEYWRKVCQINVDQSAKEIKVLHYKSKYERQQSNDG